MNWFQIVALTFLASIAFIEIFLAVRARRLSGFGWRLIVFLLVAGVAIVRPELVQSVASFLGIGRGADLVQYLTAFVLLFFVYVSYARYVRLSRQVTQLARHIAIAGANAPEIQSEELGSR